MRLLRRLAQPKSRHARQFSIRNSPPGCWWRHPCRPPLRQLRIRVVVHTGLVHYDANGCFGEALDTAFRLLDASSVKQALRTAQAPLALVVSAGLSESVRSERTGQVFSVQIAGSWHQGLIRTLGRTG